MFTHLLTDTNQIIRVEALGGLANCGEMALSAAPLVAKRLDDPDSLCRSAALIYFLRVVPSAAFEPYRVAVQQATNDADQTVRRLADRVLREKQPAR